MEHGTALLLDLQKALTSGELNATNVDDHMCRKMSKECKVGWRLNPC